MRQQEQNGWGRGHNNLATSLTVCFHCRGRNKDIFYKEKLIYTFKTILMKIETYI